MILSSCTHEVGLQIFYPCPCVKVVCYIVKLQYHSFLLLTLMAHKYFVHETSLKDKHWGRPSRLCAYYFFKVVSLLRKLLFSSLLITCWSLNNYSTYLFTSYICFLFHSLHDLTKCFRNWQLDPTDRPMWQLTRCYMDTPHKIKTCSNISTLN
jgi:hypothetical protein